MVECRRENKNNKKNAVEKPFSVTAKLKVIIFISRKRKERTKFVSENGNGNGKWE